MCHCVTCVYRVSAGHQGRPGGGADGLDVALLEDDPGRGQPPQGGGQDVGVVPGHVIVAQVIRYYQDDVGTLSISLFITINLKTSNQERGKGY